MRSFPSPDARTVGFPGADIRPGRLPGPDTRTVRFPPAPLFVVLVQAPAVGGGVAAVVVELLPWRDAVAVGSGVASVAIAPSTGILAVALGGGVAAGFVITDIITAPAVGGGTAAVAIVAAMTFTAPAVGGGAAEMSETPIAVVSAAALAVGAGSATITPGALVPAAANGGGTAAAVITRAAVLSAAAVGGGVASAVVVVFSPMGMDKSATFAMTTNATGTVPGWTPRSGYPGTVITNDALVSNGSKNVTVQCKVTLTAGWGSSTALTLRVLKNGVSIGTASINFTATTVTFSPISTSLVSTDTISLQYTCPFGANGTIQQGATNTYLYYDAA